MKSSMIVSLSRGSITSFSKVLAVMLCLSVQLMFCKHFCVMAVLPLKLCLPRCVRQYWSSKETKLTGPRLPFYIFAQSSLFFLKKSTGTQNIYWVREETVTTTLLKKHSIISIAKHLSFADKNGAGLKSTRHLEALKPEPQDVAHFMHDDTSKPFAHQHLHHRQAWQAKSTGTSRYSCWAWGKHGKGQSNVHWMWFNTVEHRAIFTVRTNTSSCASVMGPMAAKSKGEMPRVCNAQNVSKETSCIF